MMMKMRNYLGLFAACAALVLPSAAPAELPIGARAPQFVTQGALGGAVFNFNLSKALRKGPVVLYFYPKSFTQGCTIEARMFAEKAAAFKAAGATLIGLSADTIQVQQDFSAKECSSKFPVGVATPAIIGAYDVHLKKPDGAHTGLSSRTSYVIARDGRVVLAYTDQKPNEHVTRTLAAVQALRKRR
jgi:peroxiredoxin Q/BCP